MNKITYRDILIIAFFFKYQYLHVVRPLLTRICIVLHELGE